MVPNKIISKPNLQLLIYITLFALILIKDYYTSNIRKSSLVIRPPTLYLKLFWLKSVQLKITFSHPASSLNMILFGILVVLTILAWYHISRQLNHFNRMGVKQTNPWPIIGDQWRILFRRMTANELALWLYNLYPKTRQVLFMALIQSH